MEGLEAKKLDVTIQSVQQEEDELSLADIFHALKKNAVKMVAWVLIGAIIGGIAGIAYVFISRTQDVTTVISFSYDGVQKGLDPAGAVLDVNVIKSPQVVEPALEELGWTQSEDLNPETIRQAISIQGIVPQDVIDRLTVITTIATNASSVTNLEKVLDVSYYPTRFKVDLDAAALKISTSDACKLLDAVLASYRTYFYDTYANIQLLGSAIGGLDYTEYDYTEAVDLISSQLDMMNSYVSNLQRTNKDFRSVQTGFTFADITTSLGVVRQMDVEWLDALVYSYNLTRDREQLVTYLNFQKEELARSKSVADQNLTTINQKLNSYKKDTVMMMPGTTTDATAYAGMTMTVASEEYDKLVEQSIAASSSVATIKSRIDKIDARIARINEQTTVNAAMFERRCQEADERLVQLSQKVSDWTQIISKTADDYYNTEMLKDAYKIVVPTQDANSGLLTTMIKYGLLGAVGVAAVVLVIYVIGCCLSLATNGREEEKKKRKPNPASRKVRKPAQA